MMRKSGESTAKRLPPWCGIVNVGLRSQKALRRVPTGYTASDSVAGEDGVVEFRVIAAEAELETVLAGFRTVAGARVAAGFREDRLDVVEEARNEGRLVVFDRDFDRRGDACHLSLQPRTAVGERAENTVVLIDDLRIRSLEGGVGGEVAFGPVGESPLNDEPVA